MIGETVYVLSYFEMDGFYVVSDEYQKVFMEEKDAIEEFKNICKKLINFYDYDASILPDTINDFYDCDTLINTLNDSEKTPDKQLFLKMYVYEYVIQ